MKTVSVIIPTFNRARKVPRAIASVLYQTFTDYDVFVVDDGSTDDTKEVLARFKRHITYLSLPKNTGVSAARNAGICTSQSPYVAFLDSDDYWFPEKLSTQIAFFEQHPERVACQTGEIWIRKGRRVNPAKKHLKPTGDIFEPSLKRCLVSPSAVMVKRSLLKKVGLFDTGLPACEDYDLWLRISCRYPIDLIKKNLVVKEGGEKDQLSARFWGMDRFRIQSLMKLLRSGRLTESQREKSIQELSLKCRIYGNGCLKRNNRLEGLYYLQLPETIRE